MAKSKTTITINSDALKKRFGASVEIEIDENGTPIDRYWRNRARDAAIDGCITLAGKKKTGTSSKKTEGE